MVRKIQIYLKYLSTEKGSDGYLYGKEDYRKSIQYYIADGKVTRFNYVAPKQNIIQKMVEYKLIELLK